MAEARAIHAVWKQNERFGNQWIGAKMTDFLPRWRRFTGSRRVRPQRSPSAERVTIAQSRAGRCDSEKLYEVCQTPRRRVRQHREPLERDGERLHADGLADGSHSAAIDWLSTVAHVAVKVAQPSTMDDGDFYDRCGEISSQKLDLILPAWVTFDWFRRGRAARVLPRRRTQSRQRGVRPTWRTDESNPRAGAPTRSSRPQASQLDINISESLDKTTAGTR